MKQSIIPDHDCQRLVLTPSTTSKIHSISICDLTMQAPNEPKKKKHVKTTFHVVPIKLKGYCDLLITQVTIEIM
jgi:hypothetical protein